MSAFFIFTHKVHDADTLNSDYLPKAVESLGPYNPKVLVVDENIEIMEGRSDANRTVVIQFESKEQAKEWYNSEAYQNIVKLRLDSIDGFSFLCDEFKP